MWTDGEDGYVFSMAADTGMLQTLKRGDYLYWKNERWLQKKTLMKNFRFNHNFSLDNEEGTKDYLFSWCDFKHLFNNLRLLFLALSGIIREKVEFEIQKYEYLLSKYLKKVKIIIFIMSL